MYLSRYVFVGFPLPDSFPRVDFIGARHGRCAQDAHRDADVQPDGKGESRLALF